jgi:4-amino-4-deoxy-L-arabinose transferase-like glycosyltransferase
MRSKMAIATGLLSLAAVPRLIYLFAASPRFEDWHWTLATGLLQHGSIEVNGARTTDFDPLYPMFLAAVRWAAGDRVTAVQTVQVLVASFGGVCLYWLTEALTSRRRVAVVASVLYAIYPLLWRHSADGTDAALLTTLVIAFAYSFVVARTPAGSAVAGVWLGLSVLTRAAVLPLLPLAVVTMVIDGRRRAALGLLSALAVIAPFALRDYSLNGSLVPTRSGLNLFLSNSEYELVPDYGPDLLEDYADSLVRREGLDLVPASPALDRAKNDMFTRVAIEEMGRHPLETLWRKLENALYLFSPRLVPYHETTDETCIELGEGGAFRVEHSPPRPLVNQLAYSVPYAFVIAMIVAAFYCREVDFRRDGILWCIVATFTVVHMLYFPAIRYRVPMEFVLLFYCAVGVDALARRRSATKTGSASDA